MSASSVKVRLACSGPNVAGVNPTCIVQVAPSASVVLEHVSAVRLNEESPVRVAAATLTMAFPSLVSVTVWTPAVFPNRRSPNGTELGLAVALACKSLPVMLIDCGDPPASSATRREAEEVPYAVGEKVTLTEHPMVAGHCSPEQVSALRLYAAAPEPDNVIEDTSKEAVPSLITLIDWLADWPVTVLGKLTELGVNAAWA